MTSMVPAKLAQSVIAPPPTTLPSGSIETYIVNVINWGIMIAGTVAVLILIVSGFYYVTAAGDEHRIERAKTGIKGAITGIIIMLLAAVIVNTINYAIIRGGSSSSTPRPSPFSGPGGSLPTPGGGFSL